MSLDPHKDTTRRLGEGSAHWPAVPPADDGTTQDPLHPGEAAEYFGPGDGPGRIWVMVVLILLLVGLMGYLALVIHHGPGGVK